MELWKSERPIWNQIIIDVVLMKKTIVNSTWFEHATFWSGVRRATVAPRIHANEVFTYLFIISFISMFFHLIGLRRRCKRCGSHICLLALPHSHKHKSFLDESSCSITHHLPAISLHFDTEERSATIGPLRCLLVVKLTTMAHELFKLKYASRIPHQTNPNWPFSGMYRWKFYSLECI